MAGRPAKLLCVLLGCVGLGAATPCTDTYTDAFKPHKGTVLPKNVGALYKTWCKKNMKVSSAKSMDELCAPLVKKVESKMIYIPEETEVTPEMACEQVDSLKKMFP